MSKVRRELEQLLLTTTDAINLSINDAPPGAHCQSVFNQLSSTNTPCLHPLISNVNLVAFCMVDKMQSIHTSQSMLRIVHTLKLIGGMAKCSFTILLIFLTILIRD